MVLIESNTKRRKAIATALRSAGIAVIAVERIAELERWPAGDVVVTESSSFTPLWKEVGATHVVVLADSPTLGSEACGHGASAWVPRMCAPSVVLSMLQTLSIWQPSISFTSGRAKVAEVTDAP
jgi:hypothetical protein